MVRLSAKLTALAVGCAVSIQVSSGQVTGVANDDIQMMREWVKTLASDEFGGRKPMTEHEDLTINYLADQLKGLGLEPAFDGGWFQPFGMIAVTAKPVGGSLTAKGKKKVSLRYPEDAIVWTARATDMVELKSVEYVFCGFGINAPEYGWNDYEGIDVKGKIVIAMVNDPGYYDSKLFRDRNMTYYGRWLYKFEEAKRQGAAGCLVLHNTEAASYGWHVCVNGHLEDNLAIFDSETRNTGELAVKGWLHEEGARKLFEAAGMDMPAALAAAKRPGFRSFPLKVKGDIKLAVTYDIQQTRNVAAILPGKTKGDEALVMSAHWDHLGVGTPDETGDDIYNGAADNASGMAGLLLAARKFTQLPERPDRSIIFLFPSSEESGLFGSEYYCSHPAIPMEKTVDCLNFESIGPAELTEDVVILGGGESMLDRYYVAAAAAQGRCIFFDDDNSDGWFFRSDHYNFVKKGVPAVVVENGLHPADPSKANRYPMESWYHKPCDEYRDDWDLTGTLANVNLQFSVGLSIANARL
ncbi:MAG: M28 family peptidase [Bacteroidales bacterium]|nr:M28 family peptidase [Bacteroidales bacterium]